MIIRAEELKDVCSKILSAVDNTDSTVITETLELKAEGNVFEVAVTNREYFVEVKLPIDEDEILHATVNANLFLKLISQITTDTIELTTTDKTLIVKGNGIYKIPLIFDGEELLCLPRIDIENVTTDFEIPSEILVSLITYNGKEFAKGQMTKPNVQKCYYVDESGAITFTTGACVNNFTLEKPVRMLLNAKLVKLFKLFKGETVKFSMGYDPISDEIIQTKVRFEGNNVTITAILSCDDSLISSVPAKAIRARAQQTYPHSVVIEKNSILQAINRLTLFNSVDTTFAKTYLIFEFEKDSATIYDANHFNKETIYYNNSDTGIADKYTLLLNVNDLKLTLDTCDEEYLTLSFGDHTAVVISRKNIKNVLAETHIR